MIRAVVFDFDGVLANSEPLHFRGYRDVLLPRGVQLTEAAYCRTISDTTMWVRSALSRTTWA
ncbi:MAG: hypothetical protein QM736_24625 [Vicinamibacterales bacterium]